MPTSLTKYSTTPDEPQQVQIWTGSAWAAVPRLRCERLTQTVQPAGGISSAVLSYDYGEIEEYNPNNPGFQTIEPLGSATSVLATVSPGNTEIHHRFVRVVVFNPATGLPEARWVGVVVAVEDTQKKRRRIPSTLEDSVQVYGTQTLQVRGPEWLLNRKQVTRSRAQQHPHQPGGWDRIGRSIPFNIRDGRAGTGTLYANKEAGWANFNRYDNFLQAEVWSGSDIVRYLKTFFLPDSFNGQGIDFILEAASYRLLSSIYPQFDPYGKTIYQILNELINPRRFFSWRARYIAGADTAFGDWEIEIQSASATPITLPSKKVIAANTDTVSLTSSGNIDSRISKTSDSSNQFQGVIVEGALKGHVLTRPLVTSQTTDEKTISKGIFGRGWSAAEEAAYKAGVTVSPTDTTDIEVANTLLRTNQYQDVFTRFVCDSDFDFARDKITDEDQYVLGLRWQNQMPLLVNKDYTVLGSYDTEEDQWEYPTKKDFRNSDEFVKMFAVYKLRAIEGTDKYCKHSELSSVLAKDDYSIPGKASGVRLEILDDAFGIRLVPTRAEPHWQASQEASEIQPTAPIDTAFDFTTDIQVTGYFREDDHVRGSWPVGIEDKYGSHADYLILRLGDIAFHDILHPSTVVETDEGNLVKSPNKEQILRDDRKKLEDIARLAYEWYAVRRHAYAITYSQLVRDVIPGQIAVNIDGEVTDSQVTSVTWDFNSFQTSIATAYAEPDLTTIAREVFST